MSSIPSPPLLEALAETVAACLDAPSLRAMANLELDARTRERLDHLADRANEGQLTPEERTELLRLMTKLIDSIKARGIDANHETAVT